MSDVDSSSSRESPDDSKSLGQTVGKSITALALSTVVNRGVALGAQAALGYLLTQSDFGVFAIATSAGALVQTVRDGGLRTVLIQRGTKQYDQLSGPIFWMSLTCNLLAGVVLAASSPILAGVYADPRLLWILLITAALVPAGTPLLMVESRLRVDLKFDVLAKVAIFSSFGRYGVTIASAYLGAGPLSMAYGMVAATAVETIACYLASPDQPWRRPPMVSSWPGLLAQGKWTILQVLGVSLVYYAPYIPMGLFVPNDVVGVYFFAFSIVSISGHLLLSNVESVMLPSIARLTESPQRRRQAIFRSMRGVILACTPLSLFVGVAYAPLERLVWPGGQWDGSVRAVQIMAFTYPLFMLHVIPRTVLTASGHFRSAAVLMILMGIGLIAAATLSAWLGATPTTIAAGVGIYTCAAGLASCGVLKSQGATLAGVTKVIMPIWGALSAVALLVVLFDAQLWGHLPLVLRLILSVSTAGVGFLLMARTYLSEPVNDLLSVLPARFARVARVVVVGSVRHAS